jgi:probable HAF family extracellular repeat protein
LRQSTYDPVSPIDPTSGWNLVEATALNDVGQIVGYGTNPLGQTHAFLLTPTPEPGCAGALLLGACGLLMRRGEKGGIHEWHLLKP